MVEDPGVLRPASAPPAMIRRTQALAVTGGLSWALLPLWDVLPINGLVNLAFFAVPPLLIVGALVGLHGILRPTYGRFGNWGYAFSTVGLLLIAAGNAGEVVSVTLRDKENEFAHLVFFVGFFLVALPGSVLLGVALRRAGTSALLRLGGALLVVTLTLSIVSGFVGTAVAPVNSDIGFWLAIATPYGLTWMLLGVGLDPSRRNVLADPAPPRTQG